MFWVSPAPARCSPIGLVCCSSRPSIQLYPYFSWVSVFCFSSRTFMNALSVALVPNYRANWTWHNYDCIKCQRGLEFTSCRFPKKQLQHPWIWPATFIHIPYPGLTSAYHNSFSNTQGETRPCGAPESHWCTDFPTPLFTDCSRKRSRACQKALRHLNGLHTRCETNCNTVGPGGMSLFQVRPLQLDFNC